MFAITGYKQHVGNARDRKKGTHSLYKPASSENLTMMARTVTPPSPALLRPRKVSSSPLAIILPQRQETIQQLRRQHRPPRRRLHASNTTRERRKGRHLHPGEDSMSGSVQR